MIEAVLRKVFKAPSVEVMFEEDDSLPEWSVTLEERLCSVIGVESGEIALVRNQPVTVFANGENKGSTNVVGLLGHGPHHVRRQVLSRLTRHLIGGAWTLAGMIIVVVTLSGAAQLIALILCVVAFVADLMSIAIRRP
jgi:hypothetical protein